MTYQADINQFETLFVNRYNANKPIFTDTDPNKTFNVDHGYHRYPITSGYLGLFLATGKIEYMQTCVDWCHQWMDDGVDLDPSWDAYGYKDWVTPYQVVDTPYAPTYYNHTHYEWRAAANIGMVLHYILDANLTQYDSFKAKAVVFLEKHVVEKWWYTGQAFETGHPSRIGNQNTASMHMSSRQCMYISALYRITGKDQYLDYLSGHYKLIVGGLKYDSATDSYWFPYNYDLTEPSDTSHGNDLIIMLTHLYNLGIDIDGTLTEQTIQRLVNGLSRVIFPASENQFSKYTDGSGGYGEYAAKYNWAFAWLAQYDATLYERYKTYALSSTITDLPSHEGVVSVWGTLAGAAAILSDANAATYQADINQFESLFLAKYNASKPIYSDIKTGKKLGSSEGYNRRPITQAYIGLWKGTGKIEYLQNCVDWYDKFIDDGEDLDPDWDTFGYNDWWSYYRNNNMPANYPQGPTAIVDGVERYILYTDYETRCNAGLGDLMHILLDHPELTQYAYFLPKAAAHISKHVWEKYWRDGQSYASGHPALIMNQGTHSQDLMSRWAIYASAMHRYTGEARYLEFLENPLWYPRTIEGSWYEPSTDSQWFETNVTIHTVTTPVYDVGHCNDLYWGWLTCHKYGYTLNGLLTDQFIERCRNGLEFVFFPESDNLFRHLCDGGGSKVQDVYTLNVAGALHLANDRPAVYERAKTSLLSAGSLDVLSHTETVLNVYGALAYVAAELRDSDSGSAPNPTTSESIPKDAWSLLFVDSEEVVGEDGAAINAFDGNTTTIWHTQWYSSSPAHPHEIQINLGARYDIDGFRYLPRQTETNGIILDYEIYTSIDGVSWGSPVAVGTWAGDSTEKEVLFAAVTGQYVRLVALNEVNSSAYTSAAELNVLGALSPVIAPVLDPIGNKSVNETSLLSFTVSAANVISFTLDDQSVALGMGINPSTGGFIWTPTEAQGGLTPSVTIVATGEDGLTDSETIVITVNDVNSAPILSPIGSKSANEGTTLSFIVSAVDYDISSDTLVFSIDDQSMAKGMSINSSTGAFSWTPTEAQEGVAFPVTFTVTDSGVGNLTDIEAITITVNETNAAPVLATISNKSVDEETNLAFTATATDHDIPVDSISFSLDSSSIEFGMSIDANTGVFNWTPTEAQGGMVTSVTITATDSGAGNLSDSETFVITVNEINVAPTFGPFSTQSLNKSEVYAGSFAATDHDLDAITYSYSNMPAGLTGNASTGEVTGIPTESGDKILTVSANDGHTVVSKDILFEIMDIDHPIVFNQYSPRGLVRDEYYSAFIIATDADGDAIEYSHVNLPAGLTGNSATGEISGTPSNVEKVTATITATNVGNSLSQDVVFDVTDAGLINEISIRVALSIKIPGEDAMLDSEITYSFPDVDHNLSTGDERTITVASTVITPIEKN